MVMLYLMLYLLQRVPVPPVNSLQRAAVRVALTDAQVRKLIANENARQSESNRALSRLLVLARIRKAGKSQLTTYNLRLTTYDLQLTTYELRATSYELQVTSHKLQVTSRRPLHGAPLLVACNL